MDLSLAIALIDRKRNTSTWGVRKLSVSEKTLMLAVDEIKVKCDCIVIEFGRLELVGVANAENSQKEGLLGLHLTFSVPARIT